MSNEHKELAEKCLKLDILCPVCRNCDSPSPAVLAVHGFEAVYSGFSWICAEAQAKFEKQVKETPTAVVINKSIRLRMHDKPVVILKCNRCGYLLPFMKGEA